MNRRGFLGRFAALAGLSMVSVKDLRALVADELEMERRGLIPPDFGLWMQHKRRDLPEARWAAPHMIAMQHEFDLVTAGETPRLLLQVAGRHSKTEHMKGYAAYRLHRDPRTEVLFTTHSQDQANTVSDKVKDLAKRCGVKLRRDATEHWATEEGGGFRAIGIGAGTASVNADLIMIDDPLRHRADAESETIRNRVWDSITTDLIARATPTTAVIVSMPRWHVDDPAGRMQADRWGHKGLWRVLDLPGRALENDPLGRTVGAPLWPDFLDEAWHENERALLGQYGYASFIMCRPTVREGGMFKDAWWRELDSIPGSGRMVRYWDTAGTTPRDLDHDPDYTAGALLCAMPSDQIAIVDVARCRKSVRERDLFMLEVCKSDLAKYAGRVTWWLETESGIAGKERSEQIQRQIQALGMPCYLDPRPSKSKLERYEPLASKAEAGNVFLCPGDWRGPYRFEMSDIPGGTHDDQADAVAGADAKLATRHTVEFGTYRI